MDEADIDYYNENIRQHVFEEDDDEESEEVEYDETPEEE